MNPSTYPAECLLAARKVIGRQASVPPTPGKVNADGVGEFCAAAALAIGLIEVKKGSAERRKFEHRLLKSGSKEPIYAVFRKYNVAESVAHQALVYNDACPDTSRKECVLRFFSKMLTRTPQPIRA